MILVTFAFVGWIDLERIMNGVLYCTYIEDIKVIGHMKRDFEYTKLLYSTSDRSSIMFLSSLLRINVLFVP